MVDEFSCRRTASIPLEGSEPIDRINKVRGGPLDGQWFWTVPVVVVVSLIAAARTIATRFLASVSYIQEGFLKQLGI